MKYLQYILWANLLFLLPSCGEDRSGEFYALIEDRMWIEEVMLNNYLWYQDITPIENENDYFKEPATFFKNMLSKEAMNGKGDKYSYLEEKKTDEETDTRSLTLDRTSTYGMEFELTSDPTKTTAHTYARVLYVIPDSPAAQAGIQRGDWISSIDKNRITSDNYHQLINGGIISLSREQIIQTDNGLMWQAVDTLNVGPSITMEINPFLVDTLYQMNGQKIAYLVYNEFATGPNNEGTESVYHEQMKQIFTQFKSQSPDAFILDLRYNNGGFLQCAQVLGSLLAPATALGKDFVTLEFNDQTEPQRVNYPFDTQYADANLNLNKIYVLTGSMTASASEAVINGLIPYMGAENVILIGEKTEGKNVAMTAYANDAYGLTLWPVVAYVFNAHDEGDYSDGMEPQYPLEENKIVSSWYPLGDTQEYYLQNALSLITTGSLTPVSTTNQELNVNYHSIRTKSPLGIRIK